MSDYHSPHWNLATRTLRSYLRQAFTAAGLVWTADNDAEIENLVASIRFAVEETICDEVESAIEGSHETPAGEA